MMDRYLAARLARVEALLGIAQSRAQGASSLIAGRAPLGPNPTFEQDWWWDPSDVSGLAKDTNSGLTSAAPVLHWREIVRRWNTISPVLATANVTIHVMSDPPDSTDPIVARPFIPGESFSLVIRGEVTAVGPEFALGAVTARNRATGTAWSVDLGAHAAGSAHLILRNITRSAESYIDANLAGNVVRIDQPLDMASYSVNVDSYTPGDRVRIFRPIQMNIDDIDNIVLQYAWSVNNPTNQSFITAVMCRYDASVSIVTKGSQALGCAFLGGALFSDVQVVGGSCDSTQFSGDCSQSNDTIFHNTTFVTNGGLRIDAAYCDGSMDVGASSLNSQVGSVFVATSLYGTYTLTVIQGKCVYFPALAANAFEGTPTLNLGASGASGTAVDTTVNPTVLRNGRALTPAQLDTTIAGGGFGGVAVDDRTLQSRFSLNSAAP